MPALAGSRRATSLQPHCDPTATSLRRRDRLDPARRVRFPAATAGALPIEKPRAETAILARVSWQIFGALFDKRADQLELAATRLFGRRDLGLDESRHARKVRRGSDR